MQYFKNNKIHSQLKTTRQINVTDAMQLRYPIINPPVSILKHRNFSIANIIFRFKENMKKIFNEIFKRHLDSVKTQTAVV